MSNQKSYLAWFVCFLLVIIIGFQTVLITSHYKQSTFVNQKIEERIFQDRVISDLNDGLTRLSAEYEKLYKEGLKKDKTIDFLKEELRKKNKNF